MLECVMPKMGIVKTRLTRVTRARGGPTFVPDMLIELLL